MTRITRRITTATLLCVCLAGAIEEGRGQSLDEKIKTQQEKLKQIQKDIEHHRSKSAELKKQESNALRQLSDLDKEMALSGKLLATLLERENLLQEHIDSLRVTISYEGDLLDYQKDQLALRLRQMYKKGPNYRWDVIFGSADVQTAMRRYKYLQLVAERDAVLVSQVDERKSTLEEEQVALTEALADIVALKELRLEERQRLEQNKKKRVRVLGGIRSESKQHAEAIDELERSQEELKNLIGDLERRWKGDDSGLPSGDFAKLKGRLMMPVDGKITKRFGKNRHPKFGTVTFNNGINIEAGAGSPIRSVATGRVEFVDWISGYGNCIIVNHGDGYYTLYAHAAEIFVNPGDRVRGGEVIAEVGDSGSLDGFECHFEIRKSKQALNPMEWLRR